MLKVAIDRDRKAEKESIQKNERRRDGKHWGTSYQQVAQFG